MACGFGFHISKVFSTFINVSSVAEIESAIERLSGKEVAELSAWFEDYRQMINASAEMFSLYDSEEAAAEKNA